MPLQAPKLDDRTFEEIVTQAKTLIPRYAPEWTDHNESDPGITMIQLFAWMTDMLLYRLNQVPERNYVKFLQLLGIKPKPAQPARAELTFTLNRDTLAQARRTAVIVPKGTQVAAAGDGEEAPPGGGEEAPLVFETDQALIALEAELKAVQVFDGFSYSVVKTPDNEAAGQPFHPFGQPATEGSSLLLGLASALTFTDQEVNLTFCVADDPRPEGWRCDPRMPHLPVPATLVWEYLGGNKRWQALNLLKDETRAFTRSGHVHFRGPGSRARKHRIGDVQDEALYWIRCRLEQGSYERAPQLEMILTNTIPAIQALTVRDEIVGGSDGRPGQKFHLANTPIIAEEKLDKEGITTVVSSLQLEVEEGPRLGAEPQFEKWEEVPDFFGSRPGDRHYTLDRTTGEIRFGDGERGRIPPANPDSPAPNIVARLYRHGGGKAGNVAAARITELQTFVDYVDSVTNKRPAYGGADEEKLKDARRRAPQVLKSKDRAVTAGDFALLAKETPGAHIKRATALPLTHPRFPGSEIPGVVTVVIVPESDAPKPVPSEATISLVCAYLNKRRLLTTEVYVVPPTYRKVSVKADIIARPQADLAEVERNVERNLIDYFHPFEGGDEGSGWKFGNDIVYSDIYRQILKDPDVDRIDGPVTIYLDDEPQEHYKDVTIEDGELLYCESLQIGVSYKARE